MMRRVGIYIIADPSGVVEDYVVASVQALKAVAEQVFVICDTKISKEGREKLAPLAQRILAVPMKGNSIHGYQLAFQTFGWEELGAYDEVICAASQAMAPVCSLEPMFAEMADRDLDYWCVTKKYLIGRVQPESWFLVFRKAFVQSPAFRQAWDPSQVRDQGWFDVKFVEQFSGRWTSYVEMDDLEVYSEWPSLFYPTELIRNRKCPFFIRDCFCADYRQKTMSSLGESGSVLYSYLREIGYDEDMLWQHILRTMHQEDFCRNLHLNYVLPDKIYDREAAAKNVKKYRIALVMHLYFMDLLDDALHYAQSMPPEADVYITVGSEKKAELVAEKFRDLNCHALKILQVENRGRDQSGLLVGFAPYRDQYDLFCFAHDKKSTACEPGAVGESFAYQCWNNILGSSAYVYNILDTFDRNPRLGFLTMTPPWGDLFFTHNAIHGWGGEGKDFPITWDTMQELGWEVPLTPEKMLTAAFGGMFWCRTAAMEPLFAPGWDYTDFPKEPVPPDATLLHAIERLYCVSPQQAGYYPAIAETETFAATEHTTLDFYNDLLQDLVFGVIPEDTLVGAENHFQLVADRIQFARAVDDPVGFYFQDYSPWLRMKNQLKNKLRPWRDKLRKLLKR